MKKITLLFTFIFTCFQINAQTSLTAGDIAFMGSNTDGATNSDDTVAFVLLKDIDAATTIIFTDRGWNDATGFTNYSGDSQFTWTSGIVRTAGSIVTIDMDGLFAGGGAYSSIGDQLFALQGSIASPNFIAGLHFQEGGDDANWNGSAVDNKTSARPNALTGNTAVRLVGPGDTEVDNWQFNCSAPGAGGSPITGTPDQIRTILHNRLNWTSTNSTPIFNPAAQSGCTITIVVAADSTPPVITCASTPSAITAGINGMAAIPNLVTGSSATDNVSTPANITITQSPTAGTMAAVGVHNVTVTATDEAGNTDTCTINVTVNEPPSTTLSAGDIAFVGFNLDGTDSFAFVLLKDIIAGTHIRFTDCGVTNPNTISCAGTGEGTATWYSSSAGSAGDVITLPGSFITGSVLASIGDQIFAYQGTSSTPTFIAGIHSNIESGTNDADWDGQNTTNDESALPDQLVNGVNAIRLHNSETEVDNWQFDCSLVPGGAPLTGTPANIAATINNLAFWIHDDTTAYSPAAKSGCSFNVVVSSDATPPVITDCGPTPPDITADTLGEATVPDLTTAIVATDETTTDANDLVIIQSPSAGTTITAGITTVTLYVSDEAGNTTTCTIDLTVNNIVATTLSVGDIAFVGINHDGSDSFAFVLLNNILAGTNITFTDCGITDPNTISCNGTSDTSYTWFSATDQSAGTVIELQGTAIGLSLSNLGDQLFAYQGSSASPTFIAGIHTSVISGTSDGNWDGSNSNGNTSALPDQLTNGTTAVRLHSTETEVDNWQFDCALLPGGTSLNDTPSNLRALINNVAYWSSNDSSEYSPAAKASCAYTVILDPIPPVAISQDYTAQLGTSGTVTIAGTDVDNGSSDNIGIVSYSLNVDNFDCNDIGSPVVVTLTVADAAGNTDTSTSTVTVEDNIKPTVNVQNVTIYLDANGDASTNVAAIDNGSIDNCSIATMTLDTTDFTCNEKGNNIVTLTVTDVNDNVETATATVNVVDSTVPNTIAQNISVFLDGAGNATITAADIDGGTTDNCSGLTLAASQTAFTCADIGANNITLTANDGSGNTDFRVAVVTVLDTISPTVIYKNLIVDLDGTGNVSINHNDFDNGSTDNCGTTNFIASKTNFSCVNIGINSISLLIDDGNGNQVSRLATVTVQNLNAISNFASDITESCFNNAQVSFTDQSCNAVSWLWDFGDGNTSTQQNPTHTYTDVGQYTVSLTITDLSNASDTETKANYFTVQPPKAAFIGNPVTGSAIPHTVFFTDQSTLPDTWLWDFDDGNTSTLQNPVHNYTSFGDFNVTLTVTDTIYGCSDVTIPTLIKIAAPVTSFTSTNSFGVPPNESQFGCGPLTVNFTDTSTVNGNDTINSWLWDFGDGNTSLLQNPIHVYQTPGIYNVSLTTTLATTENSNIQTKVAYVQVIGPDVDFMTNSNTVGCPDLTINFEDQTIFGAPIISWVWDFGDGNSSNLQNPIHTYTSYGLYNVSLTITDIDGCSREMIKTNFVDTRDFINPTVIVQNVIAELDEIGQVSITSLDIDNGSSDNCEIDSMTLDKTIFNCDDLGDNTVMLTVTDKAGNIALASSTVTVVDLIAPSVLSKDLSIYLNSNGMVSINPTNINDGSTDNCGIASMSLNVTDFNCSNIGNNTVTLTVVDVNGNSNSNTATVKVIDNIPPIVLTKDITIQLDENGETVITSELVDNGSSDACGIASLTLDKLSFDCTNVGENIVTLTVTDVNGNSASKTAKVTVEDIIMPTVSVQNVSVELDEIGTASITVVDIDNGSLDNCEIATMTLDVTTFDCNDVGENVVTLSVTDVHMNVATATATVTVLDTILPTVTVQNISVELDESGVTSIGVADIDNGSLDNCEIATMTLDVTTFDCNDVGENIVTLSVTDVNMNVATATATVTVIDAIAPTVTVQNISVELDESGAASIEVADIDNGSFDNCGAVSLSLSKTDFTCANVGENTVTLSVTDVNMNVSTATATVSVVDAIAPTVTVQNISVELDESGIASIVATDIDNGSFDNCGTVSLSLLKTDFDCTSVGENMVTLTVTDVNMNVSTATATVTVVDNMAPTVSVQNISIELDESGSASIVATDIDNGSLDNCEIATMTLDVTAFDCSTSGENDVVLTVVDVNGNSASATAIVTVVDTVMPVASCVAPFTLSLDATGSISIAAADIDNGSSDNCGVVSLSLSKTDFTCDNIGENLVTLTVTDASGNSATCTTVVTIVDTTAPIVVTQNISVELDEFGNATISADDINDDSFDACGIASMSLDQVSFSCPTLGDHIITLTVVDVNGNSASEMAIVTFTSDDLDNDLIADVCDDDMDGDGVDNDIDNCPTTANPDQRDLDRNGIGDICDQGDLEIPKGFSPNGDGANDEFIILGLHKYPNNSIQVYNRYGNMVYESKNYQNYWDGIGNKKERRLPAAPYFYVLSIDGGTRIVKGWVYINY